MSATSPREAVPGVQPPASRWARTFAVALVFGAGYLALDWVSYLHPLQRYSITPWNPQPALAIALLMLGGQRWLLAVLGAVVAAECLVRGATPGAPTTWLVAAVLALGYAAIARAMTGTYAVDPALHSRRDAVRLVAVVAVGALVTGILYIAALLAGGQGPLDDPFEALARFWIGDAIGVLVTLPLLLMLSVPVRRAELARILLRPEAWLHGAGIAASLAVVFLSGPGQVRFFYVLFLPVVFAAARFGMAGSTLAALVIQVAVIVNGEIVGLRDITVVDLQALLIALTGTGLFLGVTVDERRRVETELRGTLRLAAAGEMAAALAHELNQPLTAVASYARAAELIAAAPAPEAGLLAGTLAKLVAESTRAAEVVRRLRDFFRTGATDLRALAVQVMVDRAVEGVRESSTARDVAIDARIPAGLPEVLADAVQVQVVLRNLLANAVDASAPMQGRREVAITAHLARPGMVEIVVRDSGPGVAAADVERIFEPFETTRAAGMGMGLAIGRAIVEAHGGRLWADAGPGGAFHVTLPAAEARRG